MMKVMFVAVFLLSIYNWISIVTGLSLLFMLLSLMSKHDMDYFEMSAIYGWDSVGYMLTLLSVWILILMILASCKIYMNKTFNVLFSFVCMLLLLFLIISFSTSNILMFYVFFEASLVPTFILILGWGYQPERLQAGVYMLMYTVFASLPLLLVLFSFYLDEYNSYMFSFMTLPSCAGLILLIGAMLAFMVKLPIYFVHLWLPKAHVEAPVSGSMILASVLLKLGGYGLIRVSSKMSSSIYSLGWFFMSWGLIGGVFVSLICLRQTDIKCLIALSSVAHMSMVFGGILTFTSWGLNGAMLIMVGHGFCSSGLFCIANMAYERSGTRSLQVMKGMQSLYPQLTLWWFLLVAANMSAPPSMNLLGEIMVIMGLLKWSIMMMIPIAGLTFLAAAYSLYMYSNTQHGKYFMSPFGASSIAPREYIILLAHWLPINFLIFKFSTLQLFI